LYDEPQISIIPGGSALYKMNTHDGVMLPYLDNVLAKPKKQFIVIHTSGSHWNYAARYPSEFEIFKPGCKDISTQTDQPGCGEPGLTNSYDNSIIYTDYILSQIIKRLGDKNAFLIYASDHAESLGENGIYGHGTHMVPEQLTITFIFWASDKFISHHPNLLETLSRKTKENLNHDYIFHSALDCIGIASSIIDSSLSLCE
jgi:glucan phosphoethanolaminetransferase (alkaline phosphatase superfamily)